MKITIRLDDSLFELAKREAEREGQTLTALIERALRLVLAHPETKTRVPVILPTCTAGGGTLPGRFER